MARDPLAILARLRKLDVDRARAALAERRGQADAMARKAEGAAIALLAERGGDPGHFAAWLQRGLAERERAERGRALAEEAVGRATARVLGARTAEAALAQLREVRAADCRRLQTRREQARADEHAGRRHAYLAAASTPRRT